MQAMKVTNRQERRDAQLRIRRAKRLVQSYEQVTSEIGADVSVRYDMKALEGQIVNWESMIACYDQVQHLIASGIHDVRQFNDLVRCVIVSHGLLTSRRGQELITQLGWNQLQTREAWGFLGEQGYQLHIDVKFEPPTEHHDADAASHPGLTANIVIG